MYDLFSGDQLIIVGRYRRPGALAVKLTGDFLGRRQKYTFEDELPKQTGSGKNVFVERLWATRRIGQIIDEIDLYGENQELVDELIILSKKHGILTPYTAYLAEERTDLNNLSLGRQATRFQLSELQQESGASAFRQRDFKSGLRTASRAAEPMAEAEMMMGGADAAGAAQVPRPDLAERSPTASPSTNPYEAFVAAARSRQRRAVGPRSVVSRSVVPVGASRDSNESGPRPFSFAVIATSTPTPPKRRSIAPRRSSDSAMRISSCWRTSMTRARSTWPKRPKCSSF